MNNRCPWIFHIFYGRMYGGWFVPFFYFLLALRNNDHLRLFAFVSSQRNKDKIMQFLGEKTIKAKKHNFVILGEKTNNKKTQNYLFSTSPRNNEKTKSCKFASFRLHSEITKFIIIVVLIRAFLFVSLFRVVLSLFRGEKTKIIIISQRQKLKCTNLPP